MRQQEDLSPRQNNRDVELYKRHKPAILSDVYQMNDHYNNDHDPEDGGNKNYDVVQAGDEVNGRDRQRTSSSAISHHPTTRRKASHESNLTISILPDVFFNSLDLPSTLSPRKRRTLEREAAMKK